LIVIKNFSEITWENVAEYFDRVTPFEMENFLEELEKFWIKEQVKYCFVIF